MNHPNLRLNPLLGIRGLGILSKGGGLKGWAGPWMSSCSTNLSEASLEDSWTPCPEPTPMATFCHSLVLDLHMAFEVGQGKYFCRHIENSRSHSHSWCEQEFRSVFLVLPGTKSNNFLIYYLIIWTKQVTYCSTEHLHCTSTWMEPNRANAIQGSYMNWLCSTNRASCNTWNVKISLRKAQESLKKHR